MSKRFRNRFERSPRDFYKTPLVSVKPLIPYLRAAGVCDFAEPCAGQGDLIRHLESSGFRCVYRGDLATGQDALDILRFPAPVITNTPYSRPILLRLLEHFIQTAPSVYLILPADFAHVAYARARFCTAQRSSPLAAPHGSAVAAPRMSAGIDSNPVTRAAPFSMRSRHRADSITRQRAIAAACRSRSAEVICATARMPAVKRLIASVQP